jgi:hypothetical protein
VRRQGGSFRTTARWRAATVLVAVVGLLAGSSAAAAAAVEWTWPLRTGGGPPEVGRRFDPPAHRYGSGHRGVDLVAEPASPVVSAGAGRISYAGFIAGRGVVVVVHGALRTTYEPVTPAVGVGDDVAAGEVIGTLDARHAGCRAAACLHWGLRRGDTYLDPLSLVGAGPVRLLPLDGSAPTAAVGVTDRAGDAAAAPEDASAPDQAPPFDLRAAASPSGALAVAALVAGLALLVRRPTPPRGEPPAAGETAARAPAGGADLVVRPVLTAVGDAPPPVDLDRERVRRRTG